MAKKRKPPKQWVYAPTAQPVPEKLKAEVEKKAAELIEDFLKPNFVKPPPKDHDFNYVEDIYTKWHKNRYFYFCSQYRSPSPKAISPTFESPFARLEHMGDGKFNLAYMRHTGQWWRIFEGLTLDECLKAIETEAFLQP